MAEQRDESPTRKPTPEDSFWNKYNAPKESDIFVVMYSDWEDRHVEGEFYFDKQSDAEDLKTALEKHDPKYYSSGKSGRLDVMSLAKLDPVDIPAFVATHRPHK